MISHVIFQSSNLLILNYLPYRTVQNWLFLGLKCVEIAGVSRASPLDSPGSYQGTHSAPRIPSVLGASFACWISTDGRLLFPVPLKRHPPKISGLQPEKKYIYICIYIYYMYVCMYVYYIYYIYILYIYYISIQCIWLKYTYQFSLVDFSLLSVNQMCKVNCFQRLLCKTARSLSCWNQSLNVFKEDQIFALQVHSVGISNMRMLREL